MSNYKKSCFGNDATSNTFRECKFLATIFRGFLIASFSAYLTLASAAEMDTQISPSNSSTPVNQEVASFSTVESNESKPVQIIHRVKQVDFAQESASQNVRNMANWIVVSDDNRSLPFVIIDKTDAKVFVFNADAQLRGATAALLGLARGDDAISGIGDKELSNIRPDERTTPAGRFVAALDRNLRGEEILWVDYDMGISLHQVHTTNLKEKRGQRLSTPTPLDNRISFGCINVPVEFYKTVVSPIFTRTSGIVYVLPETRSLHEVFNLYSGEENTYSR